jgi:tyrosyl-tRNA synthetase
MPSVEVENKKENIVLWLVDTTKIEPSRRQAREDIKNGAIRINGEKITDVDAEIDPASHFDGKFVIVRRGKKKYFLARVK